MDEVEAITTSARTLLTLDMGRGEGDPLLWEHSHRTARAAEVITSSPEVAEARIDYRALTVACYFHDVGWAMQARLGQVDPLSVLASPSTSEQLDLAAEAIKTHLNGTVADRTRHAAIEITLQMRDRQPSRVEAGILADACSLDQFGPLFWCVEMRRGMSNGQGLGQAITFWRRRQEYNYWPARINDGLRFQYTKKLARRRLRAMTAFMDDLAHQHEGLDLAAPPLGQGTPDAVAPARPPH